MTDQKSVLATFTTIFVMFACGPIDGPPNMPPPNQPPPPTPPPPVTPPVPTTPTDVLFVVDNSGSMADEQQRLAVGFERFANALQGQGDYRIAVVSTDQSSTFERAGLASFSFASAAPYQLQNFDVTTSCYETTLAPGCFRGPTVQTRVVDANALGLSAQIEAFSDNVRMGSCGSGNERGFDALEAAYQHRVDCNAGFFRSDAKLVVIFVSDEDDAGNWPIEQHLDTLIAMKADPTRVRVGVIAGEVGGVASSCSSAQGATCGSVCSSPPPSGSAQSCMVGSVSCPNGEYCADGVCQNEALRFWDNCDSCSFYNAPDCCSAQAGSRYLAFAFGFEQRFATADSSFSPNGCSYAMRNACLIESICQDDLGAAMERMARALVLER